MMHPKYCHGQVSEYDLLLLEHVLWQRPEQAIRINEWVMSQLSVDDGIKQVRPLCEARRQRPCMCCVVQDVPPPLLPPPPPSRAPCATWLSCTRIVTSGTNEQRTCTCTCTMSASLPAALWDTIERMLLLAAFSGQVLADRPVQPRVPLAGQGGDGARPAGAWPQACACTHAHGCMALACSVPKGGAAPMEGACRSSANCMHLNPMSPITTRCHMIKSRHATSHHTWTSA